MVLESKTDKTTRVLMLYNRLLQGEYIDKESFSIEHSINGRTFDRDIEAIRLFLSDTYSIDEVVYDTEKKSYYMTGQRIKPMDRMEAVVILKILLSSKSLRKDEMDGLISSILSVVKKSDHHILYDYLGNEHCQYSSKETKAIIKMIVDLYSVITSGIDIELCMDSFEKHIERKKVSPLDIVWQDAMFYIVCADPLSNFAFVKYPINIIKGFKLLNTAYASIYKEKYYKKKE